FLWSVTIYAFLTFSDNTTAINYVENQVINIDVPAIIEFSYVDEEKTSILRNQASAEVPPLFSLQQRVIEQDL
ncbi:MAG: hypothetical protein ACRC37_07520, partial [Lentisphaeria bacterium]